MTIKVPRALLASDINAYSAEGEKRKKAFHAAGRKFLKALAEALGLSGADYDLRNNMAGIAVSGEVTLHADSLYVQLYESCLSRGVGVLYRSCHGRKDYCGDTNNTASMKNLRDEAAMLRFIEHCARLKDQRKAA